MMITGHNYGVANIREIYLWT